MLVTPECIIFDFLGIKLHHEWLVDPQSTEYKAAIGNLRYNQLVEKIVASKQGNNDSQLSSSTTRAVYFKMVREFPKSLSSKSIGFYSVVIVILIDSSQNACFRLAPNVSWPRNYERRCKSAMGKTIALHGVQWNVFHCTLEKWDILFNIM